MEVTSDDVAYYLPRVERLARSFNGVGGAEFDDLVQEGSLKVFLLLKDELPVTNTAIKNAMRDWVRYCRRKGQSITLEEESMDYYASAAHGRKKAVISQSDGAQTNNPANNGWIRWADLG